MTTIAIDKNTIATDTLAVWFGEYRSPERENKMTLFNTNNLLGSIIVAVSGDACCVDSVKRWVSDGADPDKSPKGEWLAIVISKRGIHLYTNNAPYPDKVDLPFAIGSGRSYAMGAMWAGADARKAVEIVADKLCHTGGEVHFIDYTSIFDTSSKTERNQNAESY